MNAYMMYADKLNKEYTEAFDQVVTYLETQSIDEVTKDDQLNDLFDLFLTAQNAGKPVRSVTGGNMELFCRSFVSEFDWKNRLLHFADYAKTVAWCLLIFSVPDLLFTLWDGGFAALLTPTDTTYYFGYLVGMAVCALAGALVGALTRHTMFRLKKVSMRVLQIVTAAVAIVAMAALFVCLFRTKSSFPLPPWVVTAVCGGYLALYYLLNRKRLKEYKQNQVKFGDLVKAESARQFPAEMEKKYQKANARSVKKGKGELSLPAFLDREERDCDRTERLRWFYLALPPAAVAVALAFGEFEAGLGDMLLFAAITLTVTYAFLYLLWRIVKSGVRERRAWIGEKRRELGLPDGERRF